MNKLLIRVKGFTPLNPTRSARSNLTGFTLVELLVVISIIGFITVSSVVVFNIVRMNARDTVRVANIATLKRALAMYLNDSTTGYPASNGECLRIGQDSNGIKYVGQKLMDAKVLLSVPVDPLWPATAPSSVNNGIAVSPSQKFCYYYFSNDTTQYKISFFLESTSKAGTAGINFTTQ